MRFDRESWRKLYTAESLEHRALPMFTRGVRDYLLRLAAEDGTLLRSTRNPAEDLARALGIVEHGERRQLVRAIDQLTRIGYLTLHQGHLWITRFVEAQSSQTPGAKRQQRYKEKRQHSVSGDVTEASPETSPGASAETSHPTRPDPTRPNTTKPPLVVTADSDDPSLCPLDLAERARNLGVIPELAGALRLECETVQREAERFVAYWTIGGGAGRRRSRWMGKLRERVREQHEQGHLVDERDAPVPADSVNSAENFA